jgi:1-acyl-sn-glycerol-3-phosphate acyltransferase
MIQIRSTLFFVYMIVFTILYALSCFVIYPFMTTSKRYAYITGWSKGILKGLKLFCGITYSVKGMDHIHAMLDQPVILMSKHQSAFETIAYLTISPKQLCYVFKRELLYIPFFGWAMAMLRMIHINRNERNQASMTVAEQGKKRLKEGCWIIIFPEGTRAPVGKNIPYRKGGARLAVDTQAFIIPIAHNAGHCWPKNSFLKYPGHVTFSIGPVIATENTNPSIVIRNVETWIEAEMRQIDALSYQALA